jgi:YggT family protein
MVVVRSLLQAYVAVLVARVVLSYFPISDGSPLVPVVRLVRALTEPLLAPIRRVLPSVGFGRVAFDLSPLVVLVVIEVIAARLPA